MITYLLMIHLMTVDMDGHVKSTRSYPVDSYSSRLKCEYEKFFDDSRGMGLDPSSGKDWTMELVSGKECVRVETK